MTENTFNEEQAIEELEAIAAESADKIQQVAENIEEEIATESVTVTFIEALMREVTEHRLTGRGMVEELKDRLSPGVFQ